MRYCILFMLLGHTMTAQQGFGLELGVSFMNTQNSGSLDVLSTGEVGYEYKSSEYSSSTNYFFGLQYKWQEAHAFKIFYITNTFNTKLSGTYFTDFGLEQDFVQEFESTYHQFIGTYTYSVPYKRLLLPLEIGLGLRKLQLEDLFVGFLKEYSSFIFFSTGVDYKLTQNIVLGLRGTLQQGITDHLNVFDYWYSNSDIVPMQLSGDIVVRYFFNK